MPASPRASGPSLRVSTPAVCSGSLVAALVVALSLAQRSQRLKTSTKRPFELTDDQRCACFADPTLEPIIMRRVFCKTRHLKSRPSEASEMPSYHSNCRLKTPIQTPGLDLRERQPPDATWVISYLGDRRPPGGTWRQPLRNRSQTLSRRQHSANQDPHPPCLLGSRLPPCRRPRRT